ncbi:class I SAM-dependent methyltransferase [Streptomyces sp. NPDC047042]|uniref:class I SAM-dependent methyltransferase n=1 Tax=Streptomyces sp. NPDC047042 TaxID=3154807 RepID=UPI0033FDFD00
MTNLRAWTTYGRFQLDRQYRTPDPGELNWGAPGGQSPGAAVLGDVAGKRILDVGSGGGHYAAHLARDHRALVDAIDISPTQHQRALAQYGSLPGVRYLCGDAVELLWQAQAYDLVYSIHGIGFLDPHRVLPSAHHGLRPEGRIVFSVLHTDMHESGPSESVEPRRLQVRLKGLEPLDVDLWVLSPQVWEGLLGEYGFTVEGIDLLPRDDGDPVVDQLIQARRRT